MVKELSEGTRLPWCASGVASVRRKGGSETCQTAERPNSNFIFFTIGGWRGVDRGSSPDRRRIPGMSCTGRDELWLAPASPFREMVPDRCRRQQAGARAPYSSPRTAPASPTGALSGHCDCIKNVNNPHTTETLKYSICGHVLLMSFRQGCF